MRYTVFPTVRHFPIIGLVILLMFVFVLPSGHADSQIQKVGHLTGNVTFVGKLPQTRKHNLATYPDPYYCGRVSDGKGWRIGPRISVSKDSRFAGAIVFIQGLKPNKLTKGRTSKIKSLNCRFTPFVGMLRVGEDLKFQNWDPVLHQVEVFQATQQGGRLLLRENLNPHRNSLKSDFLMTGEKGIHQPGPALTYEVKHEGILFFRCPFHEYMEAWALALSHHYFAVSDKGGEFSINNIPTGTYTLVVWHPIGQTEQTVKIKDQQTIQLDIDFQPSRSTFYREPDVKTNPFGIELSGDSHIVPSVELQQE